MMRTSLYLPPALLERLRIAAREHKQPLSVLVRSLLDRALSGQEQTRLKHMYKELRQLEGAGPAGIRDASTTIDDALYGEKGAWRGNDEK